MYVWQLQNDINEKNWFSHGLAGILGSKCRFSSLHKISWGCSRGIILMWIIYMILNHTCLIFLVRTHIRNILYPTICLQNTILFETNLLAQEVIFPEYLGLRTPRGSWGELLIFIASVGGELKSNLYMFLIRSNESLNFYLLI